MNRIIMVFCLFSSSMLLTSCKTIGTEYVPPQTNLPVQYGSESLADSENVVITSKWWEHFADPQLNALIEQAFANNTDVLDAVARIESAQAQLKIAGANRLPKVDLTGGAVRNRVTGAGPFPVFGDNPRNNFQYGLNSSIELDVWGKVKNATKKARIELLASEYAQSTVFWSLSSLIANQYLSLRSLDSQLVVNQDNQAISEKSVGLAKKRLEGGVASKLDVLQAQSQLDDLRTQAIHLKRLRKLRLHQLQLLTGDLQLSVMQDDLLALPQPPLPPNALPSDLLTNRPDVMQSELQLQASHIDIALAKTALYPSIGLTGQFGGESVQLSDLIKSAARVWSLGLSLNLPIFNSGELNAKVDQANAQQKQSLATYLSVVRTAFTEVNDALVNVRAYRESEALVVAKQQQSSEMLEIANHRYKEGYSSYLNVLEAQRNYHAATLEFVQSRENLLLTSVDLFKALGGGWQAKAEQKNSH